MIYMLTAGKKALTDAGITEEVIRELDKSKCGIIIGSALGGLRVCSNLHLHICKLVHHGIFKRLKFLLAC